MATVTVRELRNNGGDVLDRVERGERLVVTRDGRPVAELRPLRRTPLSTEELLARYRRLKALKLDELRKELDDVIDPLLW